MSINPSSYLQLAVLLLSIPLLANSLRVAIFNDVHIDINYTPACGWPLCYDLGKYNMNSPTTLVETLLKDLLENYHK